MYKYTISKNITDDGITRAQLNEWFDNVATRMVNNGVDPSDYVITLGLDENNLVFIQPIKKVLE